LAPGRRLVPGGIKRLRLLKPERRTGRHPAHRPSVQPPLPRRRVSDSARPHPRAIGYPGADPFHARQDSPVPGRPPAQACLERDAVYRLLLRYAPGRQVRPERPKRNNATAGGASPFFIPTTPPSRLPFSSFTLHTSSLVLRLPRALSRSFSSSINS